MVAIKISESIPTPPPARKSAARKPSAAPLTVAQTVKDKRTEGLMGLAQLGQGLCILTGQYADAATIGRHWPNVAPELAGVAEEHDWLAKPIDLLIEVGPFGALIAALLPFGMQIAANHGWVNADALSSQGVVPPQVLEAQMKADVARMQADAMRQQAEAMREAQRAQADYEAMMAETIQIPPEGMPEGMRVAA
jgi:hypothetical protein